MTPEDKVQLRVRKIYEAAGGAVYDLSQGYRPDNSTRQTEGLGDVFVLFPEAGVSVWHETKSIRPSDLAKKDWLASRFRTQVVRNDHVEKITALGICDIPHLCEALLQDLGADRRRELYLRKQSKAQKLFQARIEATAGLWKAPPIWYVLGGVLEALELVQTQNVSRGTGGPNG